jgi:hypothetical protein
MRRFAVPAIALLLLTVGGSVLFFRIRSNETSAKGSLVMIYSLLLVYESHCGEYPSKLTQVKVVRCGASEMAVPDALLSGHVDGYDIRYEPSDTDRDGKLDFYVLRAVPTTPWLTGRKTFVIDSNGARHIE